jgi:hypothetical protein
MKLLILLSLLSTSVSACPDLRGSYGVCSKGQSLEELPGLKISQTLTRGVTTYEFVREDEYTGVEHREVVMADGEFRETDEGSDNDIQYKIAYHCKDNSLHYESVIEQDQNGENVRIGIKGSMEKVENQLVLKRSGTMVLDTQGRISVKNDPDITICK